ncbi:CBY1-interacting BAR domain-containing protein 2-like [Girardinichthys multiradiatus]|uniref:CBY1-interacting BAR domain-containing protein 2-like n=1 Tax=Girardinichthys multiradiatus TaxID=208333 RepID=UPI001FAB8FEB|nr:CBY1-interacting BAR domain-containing protein 2-like [Girardinichthys multiradiatus]
MSSLFSRRDFQMQAIEQILKNSEKNLGEICTILASYTRKTAKLRDKADLLVATLLDFSHKEDPEFQIGLKNLAEDLAMVQDYRHAQVERLETTVVTPLKAYGYIVKNKRAELKNLSGDLNREHKELQKLEKIRLRNSADRQSISQAEVSAQKASTNAQRSIKQIEETITEFQRQQLEDVKKSFLEFITIEMLFHAKALEVFSHTYRNMEAIDVEKDLELFTGRIGMLDSHTRPLDSSARSQSSPLTNQFSSLPLASWRGQALSPMEASNTGQSHRQWHSQRDELAKKSHSSLQCQEGMEEELEQEEDEEEEEEEEFESKIEQDKDIRQSYAAQYAQKTRKQN